MIALTPAAEPTPTRGPDLSRFFVAENAVGDQTIWRQPEGREIDPVAVLIERQLRYAPELWVALVALVQGAGS